MSRIRVVNYQPEHQRAWDDFVDRAKNGVFLFRRDYMDYHADRFPDSSLMFFDDSDQLLALMPATTREQNLISHAGLTYGGIVSGDSMKTELMLEIFLALAEHLRAAGRRRITYKAVPHIYHRLPAEEDLYALFRCGARLVRRDVSVAIDMRARLPFSKGRRWATKQAEKAGLSVARSFDFASFMTMEEQLLEEKFATRPVHTAAEIELLANRFSDNIKLFAAHHGDTMVGGLLIYESAQVAHAQYIATTEQGRKFGAVDLIVGHLINDYYAAKRYFDFGISTEDEGRRLNTGLIKNKEGYGARAVVYDFYELELKPNQ